MAAPPPGVLSLDALPLATPLPPPAALQPGPTPNGTSHAHPSSSPISLPPHILSLLKPSAASGHLDLSPFLSPSFDPQDYANRIIDADAATASEGTRTPKGGRTSRADGSSPLPSASSSHLDVQGDVSLALSRVNLAIDDVAKLIQDEITTHAHSLLSHSTSLLSLSAPVSSLRTDLSSLSAQLSRLESRVSQPYADLVRSQARLSKLRRVDELLARASRFVVLTRRLEAQMRWIEQRSAASGATPEDARAAGATSRSMEEIVEDVEQEREGNDVVGSASGATDSLEEERGRGLARAALSVREIDLLLLARPEAETERDPGPASDQAVAAADGAQDGAMDGADSASSSSELDSPRNPTAPSLDSLDFVRAQLPLIDEARARVTEMMEDLVVRGLRDLSPTLLSTSLQTAFNLGHLPDLVRDLLADLTDVIRERVRAAFDVATMARAVGSREPPSSSYASYRSRRSAAPMTSDGGSQDRFEWSTVLFDRLTSLLVGEMGAVCSKVYTLEKVLRLKTDVASGRNFLDEAMLVLGNKPSFLFWTTLSQSFEAESSVVAKASPFVNETLSASFPRLLRIFQEFFSKVSVWTDSVYSHSQQSPETVVLLRSASKLQATYVSRCSSRLDDVANAGFSSRGGAVGVPDASSGASLAHQVANEIDGARFDPLLLHDVAGVVDKSVGGFLRRLEGLRATDASAYTLLPSEATRAQAVNAELANAVWHLRAGLEGLVAEAPPSMKAMISKLIERSTTIYSEQLIDPLLSAVRAELHSSLGRMHLADFSRAHDAVSGSGSAYMSEASDRLWFVREQLLMARHRVSALEKRRWALVVGSETLVAFLVNASLVRRMGEGGKLKMTSDMTSLEWQIAQLVNEANEEAKREVARAEANARRNGTTNAAAGSASRAGSTSVADCRGERELRAFKRLIYTDDGELLRDSLVDESHSAQAEAGAAKGLRAHVGLGAPSSLHSLVVAQHLLGRLIARPATIPQPFEALGLSRAAYVDEACRRAFVLSSPHGDGDDQGEAQRQKDLLWGVRAAIEKTDVTILDEACLGLFQGLSDAVLASR